MPQPRLDYVTCASPAGLHRMAYWEWGDPGNDRVLICVHGLTRNGRDFDELAQALSRDFRVVCPDVAGRGASDWLANPAFYTVPQYVADMLTLIQSLRPASLSWVGTSMGGLIGMSLAGASALAQTLRHHPAGKPWKQDLPDLAPVRFERMVLNDVGPRLELAALGRIGAYVGAPGAFGTFAAAEQMTRSELASFGPLADVQWEALARRGYRELNGHWVKHYDLSIAAPLVTASPDAYAAGEQLLWQSYESLDCPILILRGERSDLLSRGTVEDMRARNPRAQFLEIPEVGHAPSLMTPQQIQPVAQFLLR